jgi:hypothetical protein
MRPWIVIWLALVAVHAAVLALGWAVGSDWLAAIVVGSIYLPLWPLGKLGIPVVQQTGWFFPPPTLVGWVAIVICWSLVYWCIAVVVAWLLAMRNRAA